MLGVEAIEIPNQTPYLDISFLVDGRLIKHSIRLPVILTKFMGVCLMGKDDFLARWRLIGGPPKEIMTKFSPSSGLSTENATKVAIGLGFSVLQGIDPNADNLVLASILSSTTFGKIGCLVRLEANLEQKVFKLHLFCRCIGYPLEQLMSLYLLKSQNKYSPYWMFNKESKLIHDPLDLAYSLLIRFGWVGLQE